jgi:hypothetical protein
MVESMNAKCENCLYYEKNEDLPTNGRCHRNPPQVVTDDEGDPYTMWPFVSKDEYCGEYLVFE